MSEPFMVGINEAQRLTGKNKATISRDSKLGKLSFTLDPSGAKRYQIVELERVYGKLRDPSTGYQPVKNHLSQPDDKTTETSGLPDVVKAKDEVIDLLKTQIEDLKKDRDQWRDQAQRALPAPVIVPEPPPAKKRGFFSFLRKDA